MNKVIVAIGGIGVALSISSVTLAQAVDRYLTVEPTREGVSYRPAQGFSYDLGSKRAVGFFVSQDNQCGLTVLVGETVDPESRALAPSAARLNVTLATGQSAEVASQEGRTIRVTCIEGASAVTVAMRSTGAS